MDSTTDVTPSSPPVADHPVGRSRLVVLMFTDLVGSTGIKDTLTTPAFLPLLRRHDALLREAVAAASGRIQQDTGDGGFAVFGTSSDAVTAALRFQWLLNAEPWPQGQRLFSRIGIHLGEVAETDVQQDGGNKLVGLAIDLTARVMSLAQGGQILMTCSAFNDARQFIAAHPAGASVLLKWIAHGPYLFKGSAAPLDVFEVGVEGQSPLSAPPDSEKARRALRAGDEQTLGWRPAIGLSLPGSPLWLLEKKIGEGGFGEVWLARHAKSKSVRVFKFCFDAERLRALKREVALFRLLKEALGDRRDISRVIDWRFDEAPYFIEMDHAPEGNLATWADKQGGIDNIPLVKRLKIVVETARALSAAHSVGILHKDIKPSNVLIMQDADGEYYPRLTDFGIGVLTDKGRLKDFNITEAGFTASGLTMNDSSRTGTRMYAPPESMSDKPHTVQGDIYAVGVMLYQMIVGDLSKPLGVGWERNVADDLLRDDITACVDVDPSLRFSSSAELADRLETLDARRADRHRIAKQAETERLAKRHRAQIRILVGALALLMGVVLAFGLLWREASRQRRSALANAQRAVTGEKEAQTNEQRAVKGETLAKENERTAKLRLAEGLVFEGDALNRSGRVLESWNVYWEAFDLFEELRVSPIRAEAAICATSAESSPPLMTLQGHPGFFVRGVALSPDGRTALSGSDDQTLKMWDLQNGNEIRTFYGNTGRLDSIAISPDGRTALSGSRDNVLKVWDMQSGKEIRSLRGRPDRWPRVAIGPDGRTALWGDSENTLKVWDMQSGKVIRTIQTSNCKVNCLAIGPDGRTALSGNGDNTLKVRDLQSGDEIHTLNGHTGPVVNIAIRADGRTAFSGSSDGTLKLWDLQNCKEIQTVPGQGHGLVSPDRRTVLSGSPGKFTTLWDLQTGEEICRLQEDMIRGEGSVILAHAPTFQVAMSADGRTALSSGDDKTLKLWNLQGGKDLRTLQARVTHVSAVAIGPDSRTALSGNSNGTLTLWDLQSGQEIRTVQGHTKSVAGVAVSSDGRTALSGSYDEALKLWDLQSGQEIRTLQGHTGGVSAVAISPDGGIALTGNLDKTLTLWDLRSGREIRTLQESSYYHVNSVAISPDGRTAVSGSQDKTLSVWDLQSGREVHKLQGHTGIVLSVAISLDGRAALSGSMDKTLKLWDLQSGKEIRTLHGHTHGVFRVAISPDGRTALTAGFDKTLKLWDLQSGKEIRTLLESTSVSCVAMSADGRTAISGGDTLKLWDFSRCRRYREFSREIPKATQRQILDPNDAHAFFVLGDWYAFRGKNDWAIELLEKARAGGVAVDPLTLARCYWELSDDIPPKSKFTRDTCLAGARREYDAVLAAAKDPKDVFYLQLCLAAVERAAAVPPATQPTTAPT